MNRLRTLSGAVAVACFVLAPAAFAQPADAPRRAAPTPAQIEREVARFRDDVRNAIEAKDAAKLRRYYLDSFTHTDATGKMDGKDARIVAVIAADPAIENSPADEVTYRVFGGDTVIVTGRSAIPNKTDNRRSEFRWIVVYVKAGGAWRMAASQATRLPAS